MDFMVFALGCERTVGLHSAISAQLEELAVETEEHGAV